MKLEPQKSMSHDLNAVNDNCLCVHTDMWKKKLVNENLQLYFITEELHFAWLQHYCTTVWKLYQLSNLHRIHLSKWRY